MSLEKLVVDIVFPSEETRLLGLYKNWLLGVIRLGGFLVDICGSDPGIKVEL